MVKASAPAARMAALRSAELIEPAATTAPGAGEPAPAGGDKVDGLGFGRAVGENVDARAAMRARIASLTSANTLALGAMHAALFAIMRGDHARAAPKAFELARLAREHQLTMYGAFGAFLGGCATAEAGATAEELEGMRRGVESLREQNVLLFDGLLKKSSPREICGLRLARDFRRRTRKNGRNSARRPRHA